MSTDALIDAVWGPARTGADNRLQMAVARLRKALEPLNSGGESVLRTVAGGYLLSVAAGELDAEVFAAGVREGREALAAGEPARAAGLLGEVVGLWRGPALAEVAFEDFAQGEIRRLEELRLVALETRIDAELLLGRHAALIGELEGLLVQEPTRERLAGQLMLALYRHGRQAEALEVYQRTRALLAGELGLEPGPALKTLQEEILQLASTIELKPDRAGAVTEDRGIPSVPVRGELPARTEVLLGREREQEDLSLLLGDPEVPLVTLTGTGGAGKTTLALAAARRAGSVFADGATVVWLAAIADHRQVMPEIARALGVELSGQGPVLETLTRVLRFQCRLLVLDNFEHVIGAAPALARLVAAFKELKVLVTSRVPLRVTFERVYGVSGLAGPQTGEASRKARCATGQRPHCSSNARKQPTRALSWRPATPARSSSCADI